MRSGRPKKSAAGVEHDTRDALKASEVRELLAAAVGAIPEGLLKTNRLALPGDWPEVRRIALLKDDVRRACLLELLVDEGRRIEGER